MVTETAKELALLLKEIDDSKDFIIGTLAMANVIKEQKALIRYINETENVTSSDVLEYALYMRNRRDDLNFLRRIGRLRKAHKFDPISQALFDKLFSIEQNITTIRRVFENVDTTGRQQKLLAFINTHEGLCLEDAYKQAVIIVDEEQEHTPYDPSNLTLDYSPTTVTYKLAELISKIYNDHDYVQLLCNDVGERECNQQELIDFIEAGENVDGWTIVDAAIRIGFRDKNKETADTDEPSD